MRWTFIIRPGVSTSRSMVGGVIFSKSNGLRASNECTRYHVFGSQLSLIIVSLETRGKLQTLKPAAYYTPPVVVSLTLIVPETFGGACRLKRRNITVCWACSVSPLKIMVFTVKYKGEVKKGKESEALKLRQALRMLGLFILWCRLRT